MIKKAGHRSSASRSRYKINNRPDNWMDKWLDRAKKKYITEDKKQSDLNARYD